jgi:hypothetical protein
MRPVRVKQKICGFGPLPFGRVGAANRKRIHKLKSRRQGYQKTKLMDLATSPE